MFDRLRLGCPGVYRDSRKAALPKADMEVVRVLSAQMAVSSVANHRQVSISSKQPFRAIREIRILSDPPVMDHLASPQSAQPQLHTKWLLVSPDYRARRLSSNLSHSDHLSNSKHSPRRKQQSPN